MCALEGNWRQIKTLSVIRLCFSHVSFFKVTWRILLTRASFTLRMSGWDMEIKTLSTTIRFWLFASQQDNQRHLYGLKGMPFLFFSLFSAIQLGVTLHQAAVRLWIAALWSVLVRRCIPLQQADIWMAISNPIELCKDAMLLMKILSEPARRAKSRSVLYPWHVAWDWFRLSLFLLCFANSCEYAALFLWQRGAERVSWILEGAKFWDTWIWRNSDGKEQMHPELVVHIFVFSLKVSVRKNCGVGADLYIRTSELHSP